MKSIAFTFLMASLAVIVSGQSLATNQQSPHVTVVAARIEALVKHGGGTVAWPASAPGPPSVYGREFFDNDERRFLAQLENSKASFEAGPWFPPQHTRARSTKSPN